MQRKLQKTKAKGREPVPNQMIAGMESRKALIEAVEEDEAEEAPQEPIKPYEPVLITSPAPPAERKKSAAEPKNPRGVASFRLPSTELLRFSERSERIQEDELKECARSIEQKCKEF